MHRTPFASLCGLAILLLIAVPASAQPVFDILQPSPRAQDPNWEIPGSGFSVSNSAGVVRVYANSLAERARWKPDLSGFDGFRDGNPLCAWNNDPINWTDPRCSTDSVGLFWKPEACLDGETTCGWGGTWNGYPGEDNTSTQPHTWLWPNQSHEPFGTKNFASLITHLTVNAVTLQPQRTSCANGVGVCPPPTGSEAGCFPDNPNTWSTGTANSKVVEVRYSDGSSRWFMALNSMNHIDPAYALGHSWAADIWRVLWAYSDDGENWTIDPQILFRDTSEATAKKDSSLCTPTSVACCRAEGPLVTDLLVDGGYFYLTMTNVNSLDVYLLRSPVDTWRYSVPGYGSGWEIVSGTDFSGNWTWSPVSLGQQVDFASLGINVMPGVSTWGGIRQAALTRVFESSAANSDSRYVALVAEGGNQVWLYTADSLATGPFQRRSQVTLDLGHPIGAHGIEFAFTKYPDNVPATPRVVDDQLDVWFVTNKTGTGSLGTTVVVDRFTAAIYNLF